MKHTTLSRSLSAFFAIVVLFVSLTLVTKHVITNQMHGGCAEAAGRNSDISKPSENSLYFQYYKILKSRSKMHKV